MTFPVQTIASPACRAASRLAAPQRAATLDRKEMQASVSDDTFRTLIAEDRKALSAPVPANPPHPSPRCASVFNEEPEAPAVRKPEVEAEEPGAPAACKTEMEAAPTPLAASSDDVSTHLLPPAPAAPPAPSTDEQVATAATTTAWERRNNSNDCYSNRSYTKGQRAGAQALARLVRLGVTEETLLRAAPAPAAFVSRKPTPSRARADVSDPAASGDTRDPRPASGASSLSMCLISASTEELDAPATRKTEMEAEPAPGYDAEQARLEAVEKMRLWHAERDAALPARSARLAIVARAVTNHHGGKHDDWDIMDEFGEGSGAPTDENTPPPAAAELVKMAEAVVAPSQGEAPHLRINSYNSARILIVENDNDCSSSARSTDVAPTDGIGWGLQKVLRYFTVSCATGADDAASNNDLLQAGDILQTSQFVLQTSQIFDLSTQEKSTRRESLSCVDKSNTNKPDIICFCRDATRGIRCSQVIFFENGLSTQNK